MSAPGPLIFLIAGEPSGDMLGGRLMAALKDLTGDSVRFVGVGGPAMIEQGLDPLFAMSELTLMGLAEVLPHLPRLIRRIGETARAVKMLRPDALITIDAPDFSFRVARRVAALGVPRIHYVAPQVWAWRPERARKLAGRVDRLLALLPFEPAFFAPYGVPCDFVGHSVVEGGAGRGDGARFRARHAIGADERVLLVLPGSRAGEVRRHLSIFGVTVDLLARRHRGLRIVVPTVPGVAALVKAGVGHWPSSPIVVEDPSEKFDAFAGADAALAASGTVTAELALSGVPSVVAYRVNPLSAMLARRLLTVEHVALVNVVLGRRLLPECLQEECAPEPLAREIDMLLDDEDAAHRQREGFKELAQRLGVDGEPPSRRAARAVLATIGR